MAGRIRPLLICGNGYSRKLPAASIDGVVVDCECTIGVLVDPLVDEDVKESPQAASTKVRSSKKRKYSIRLI